MTKVPFVVLCAMVGACGNVQPSGVVPDAVDASRACYGSDRSLIKVCVALAPSTSLVIDSETIDTDGSSHCAPTLSGGDGYCVVLATDIIVNNVLRGIGLRPLVLVATNSIGATTVDALIDVGSRRAMDVRGAGHDPASCRAPFLPTSHGGGAGGSFTGTGGAGGAGEAGSSGGEPGSAIAATPVLRGGCSGQDGDGSPGSAGHGGGAVFLIAGEKIDFAGSIDAGGQGGAGGTTFGGGGGGGAGGMIGLDAPYVSVGAYTAANGGGGGEGGSQAGVAGSSGKDGERADAALGGSLSSNTGGDGGASSSMIAAGAGAPGQPGTGGGGGGGAGGAGLIIAPANAHLGRGTSPPPETP